MNNCIIGHTGFVGGTLKEQRDFQHFYRSTDIENIKGQEFDLVVCAGASAKKWLANKEPENDLHQINYLLNCLSEIKANKFILISTVDVFKDPININELTPINEEGLHPYGKNRYLIEKFVEERFKKHLVVRLPGLVGMGLQKNAIYDFKHKNNIEKIDSRGIFQFYPMQNLNSDIESALKKNINKIHLTSEPISISEIAQKCFKLEFENHILDISPRYDMKTIYPLHGAGDYTYDKDFILKSIKDYASS